MHQFANGFHGNGFRPAVRITACEGYPGGAGVSAGGCVPKACEFRSSVKANANVHQAPVFTQKHASFLGGENGEHEWLSVKRGAARFHGSAASLREALAGSADILSALGEGELRNYIAREGHRYDASLRAVA